MIKPLECVCQKDVYDTEIYRLILEDAYGAGLED